LLINSSSSHARLQQKLNILITEIRAGKREGSFISSRTFNSVAENDFETWQELRRELEDIGISPAILTENCKFIIKWFQEAIAAGGLADIPKDDGPEDDFPGYDGYDSYGDFYDEVQSLSLSPPHTPKQRTTDQTRLYHPTEQPEGSTIPEQTSRRKSQPQFSHLLNTLLRRDGQLRSVAKIGDLIAVKKLLEKGVDVNAKVTNRGTALQEAARYGHEAVVLLLLYKGADVDAKNVFEDTALSWAALKGYEAIVQLLLGKGADANTKNGYGETPLHMAASKGYEAIVQLLLGKGADANTKNEYGQTPLRLAFLYSHNGSHKAVIQLLVENGADINIKTKNEMGRLALRI
jgi:hypothetical protein